MSVEQTNIVDFITEEKGKKVLIVTDHLPWDEEQHLFQLQEKLNAYLCAIETEQLTQYYPNAKDGFRIRVCVKYQPDDEARTFLCKVKHFLADNGYDFQVCLFDEESLEYQDIILN